MHDLAAQSIALALGVSALITLICRRLKFPALLPLLGAGLVLRHSGVRVIDRGALGDSLEGFVTVAIGLPRPASPRPSGFDTRWIDASA